MCVLQKRNEIVIWDQIIPSAADARLNLTNEMNKYPIIDQHTDLRGAPVSLSLHWDIMPITGLLQLGGKGSHTVQFPEAYCSGIDDASVCVVQPVAASID